MYVAWLALRFFPGFFLSFSQAFLLQGQSLNPSIGQVQSPFFKRTKAYAALIAVHSDNRIFLPA